MRTIHAIYRDGVFRPVGPVDLPDPCEVEFEPRPVAVEPRGDALDKVYAILSERYRSGERDVAERHNEHQP
jgi:predicted DNA-binding antitoxin AbrB/MazE fold protein